jgi:hypothetical protein
VTLQESQEPEDDAGAGHDAEASWQAAKANLDGVMTVNVESLSRPEHENREEVGTGNESDDQGEDEGALLLANPAREHGICGIVDLPENEAGEDENSQDERHKDVGRCPGILHRAIELVGDPMIVPKAEREAVVC